MKDTTVKDIQRSRADDAYARHQKQRDDDEKARKKAEAEEAATQEEAAKAAAQEVIDAEARRLAQEKAMEDHERKIAESAKRFGVMIHRAMGWTAYFPKPSKRDEKDYYSLLDVVSLGIFSRRAEIGPWSDLVIGKGKKKKTFETAAITLPKRVKGVDIKQPAGFVVRNELKTIVELEFFAKVDTAKKVTAEMRKDPNLITYIEKGVEMTKVKKLFTFIVEGRAATYPFDHRILGFERLTATNCPLFPSNKILIPPPAK